MRLLATHVPLAASSRLGGVASRIGASHLAEALVLAGLGAAAAILTATLDLGLRVPGHAILRSALPFALGLALVPRRGAGTLMGCAALLTLGVRGLHAGFPGGGAATSLALTGPVLDLAVGWARSGRGVVRALAAGGLAVNLLAFGVKAGGKLLGGGGLRPLGTWLPEAAVTYPLCGLAAGSLAGILWFRSGAEGRRDGGA